MPTYILASLPADLFVSSPLYPSFPSLSLAIFRSLNYTLLNLPTVTYLVYLPADLFLLACIPTCLVMNLLPLLSRLKYLDLPFNLIIHLPTYTYLPSQYLPTHLPVCPCLLFLLVFLRLLNYTSQSFYLHTKITTCPSAYLPSCLSYVHLTLLSHFLHNYSMLSITLFNLATYLPAYFLSIYPPTCSLPLFTVIFHSQNYLIKPRSFPL